MADATTFEQPDADKELLKRILRDLELAEPAHQRFCNRGNHFYALYENYQDYRSAYASTGTERGRDAVRRDGQKKFGAELFIPMVFGLVETVLPKLLANRPKMKPEARDPVSEANVGNAEFLIDAQQEQIGYELVLQDIAKTGLIYGLGVQKVGWKTDYRERTRWVPSDAGRSVNPSGLTQQRTLEVVYDDPEILSIDPFDFIWDPFGNDVKTCEYLFHRTWRSNRYVRRKIQLGQWRNIPDEESVLKRLDSAEKWDEVWKGRNAASGFGSVHRRGDRRVHEVLEWHDGEQVGIVLDRQVIVESGENPHWHGKKPFQVYRPTRRPNQMLGKGEIEPAEDLQEEMNTLRRQRRDNASFVLQKVIAYAEGMVRQEDIQFMPAGAIPTDGDPRELLFPIDVGDIPYSGYQEEDRLRGDFERTTGLSDPVMGVASPGTTATAAQLVYQSATERIKNKTNLLALEIINPGTEQMYELDQQKILERPVRLPQQPEQAIPGVPPQPGQEPEARWKWVTLGPLELAGNFAWRCGDSTLPENVPQMRSDGELLWNLGRDNPNVDQRKLIARCLELGGLRNAETYLAPPKPEVPPETLDILVNEFNVPREQIAAALNEALTGQAPPNQAQAQTNGSQTPQEVPTQ